MKGHLLRCRFGIPPHVRLSTLRGDSSLRLASDPFSTAEGKAGRRLRLDPCRSNVIEGHTPRRFPVRVVLLAA